MLPAMCGNQTEIQFYFIYIALKTVLCTKGT